MPEDDVLGDAIERLEYEDGRSHDVSRAAQITRRAALTGGAAGLAAAMLEACGSSADGDTRTARSASNSASPVFGVKRRYRFAIINHVTDNSFFTPTQNGAYDACQLLGCAYEWTGSAASNVAQMIAAIELAISAEVDGIATSLIAARSFEAPIASAIEKRIPVVSYNADAPGTERLAYIGQDLLLSGQALGERIRSLVPAGARIALFVATPGTLNLAPRLKGIQQVLSRAGVTVHQQASGAVESEQQTAVDAFIGRHLSSYAGYFAVDGGSTAAVAQAMQKYGLHKRGVFGGGCDLLPATQQLLDQDVIQFTIDQQPYLQGFLAILQLFLHKASMGQTGAADVDTGVTILGPRTIGRYYGHQSRYEGTGTSPGLQRS